MNPPDPGHPPHAEMGSTSFGDFLVEFAGVIVRRRKFLLRLVAAVTAFSILLALVLPKWYKATASVFPAENIDVPSSAEALGLLTKGFSAARALTSFSGSPELDRYNAILKSKSVLEAVIAKFDLVRVYDITKYPLENTTKELLSNVEIQVEPEGNITVAVYDKEPQRAADMANFFIEELNRVNARLLVQNARSNREFVEQRFAKTMEELTVAEDSLKAFQKRFGIVALAEQTQASIKALAELSGEIASKEIQRSILERTLGPEHPSLVESGIELQELDRKLNEYRTGAGRKSEEMNVIVPLSRVPDLGAEYLRRYRDVEIQYKILQFVTPLYEQAKVDEQRQSPSVLVLDSAVPPERKAKPRISVFALLGFVMSVLLGLFIVFAQEGIAKLRSKHPERFRNIGEAIRNDWEALRSLGRPGRRG